MLIIVPFSVLSKRQIDIVNRVIHETFLIESFYVLDRLN